MPITKIIVMFAALVGLANGHAGAQPARGTSRGSALEHEVDAYLRPLLRTNNFSGVILAKRGDQLLLHKGYGLANIEHDVPNGPTTVFQIASVSKPFTSAAIMLLQEDGMLDVRAPLARVLPKYPNGQKLTIHHLLTHTSGIPNINDFPEYEALQVKPHSTSELVAHFRDKPLEFEPGARYSYSNSNYNLLANVIEKVSGLSYGEFLKLRIFDRLGLRNIGHHASAREIIPGLADGYAPAGAVGLERAAYIDWTVKTGNGSLYSDAAAVARFIRAVHTGRILSDTSRSATFTKHTPNAGYGWFLTQANDREIHHANGRSPGYAAQADYYVADDVTIVVLSNTYVSVTTDIARAVGALVFGLRPQPMPAIKSDPLRPEQIERLTGNYQFGPDYYVPNALITVSSREGHLEAMVGESGPYSFVQISPTSFLIRSFWVPAEFALGEDGRASQLTIDGRKGTKR